MTKGIHGSRNRLLGLAMIGVFDIAGPLVAYSMLRSAGQSQVSALILSGAFPALGADTSKGREFESLWQHEGVPPRVPPLHPGLGRRVPGGGGGQVVIVETASTTTALTVSKVMPYAVAGSLIVWMTVHGRQARREGERIAAQTTPLRLSASWTGTPSGTTARTG